ncbi:MAG: tetratricopeptide repeat protein, partial [Anaerolineales bacterium]
MSSKGAVPGLEVRLLGGLSIKAGRKPVKLPSRAAQSLFAFLILNAGTSYRREKLAGQLWPESTEERAREYLRHALWRIRKALEPVAADKLIHTHDFNVTFDAAGNYWLDTAAVTGAPQRKSPDDLIQALRAYGGELLPGFYDEWVSLERDHIQAVYQRELERLLDMLQQAGRWSDVLEWAEKWIALGQRPEPAYRALMLAHAAVGDMSRVAAAYERCRESLQELGFEPSEATTSLYEELRAGRGAPGSRGTEGASAPRSPPASNIPVPLSSFIGREDDLEAIGKLIPSARLVTLTGPGGVGKTRLAIEAAGAARQAFKDGVCWVDLAGLTDPNRVPQKIAESLGVREDPGEPLLDTIVTYLSSRQLLLVLDNCERLIDACARVAEKLLAGCPGLRILATSIEALGISGETVWQVPPLSLPESGATASLKGLLRIESIRLFETRAQQASAAFALCKENAGDVVQICRRLDGIPLAIELAAARANVLAAPEIAARLDGRLSLLTSGSRTADARHQTLRATFDWSHDLLTEAERSLFRRLSIFSGGFTIEAAETVAADTIPQREGLDLLCSLVNKSLVMVEPKSNAVETRYRLLETLRQYAMEKLMAAGEEQSLRQLHLNFHLKLAEEAEQHVYGQESAAWFRRMGAELENFRAAIDWSTSSGKAVLALRILGAVVHYWEARGFLGAEWNDRMHQALARPEAAPRTLVRAKALNGMGLIYWSATPAMTERAELEEALSISRELSDPWNTAMALRNLGLLENIRGHWASARDLLEQSLEIWAEIESGGGPGRADTLSFLGDALLNLGDRDRARRIHEESVDVLRGAGDYNFLGYSVRRLAHLAWLEGDYEEAFALCKESLRLNQQIGDPRAVLACLAGFAAIATAQGKYAEGATLAGAVERECSANGIRLLLMDRNELQRNLDFLRGQMDERAFEKARSRGQALALADALALALE